METKGALLRTKEDSRQRPSGDFVHARGLGSVSASGTHSGRSPVAAWGMHPVLSAMLSRRLLPPWQDFPHISEFPSGSGSRSPGPSNPTTSGDWDSSYPSGECSVSTCRSVLSSPQSHWCCLSVGTRDGEEAGRRWDREGPCKSQFTLREHFRDPVTCSLQRRTQSKAGPQKDPAGLVQGPLGKRRPIFGLALSSSWCFPKGFHVPFTGVFGQVP